MKISSYLIVELDTDFYGKPLTKMRIVKNKPSLLSREIAFELSLNLPDVFFDRVVPVVDINLPPDMLVNPDPNIVVSLTAGKVAEALKLDVRRVEDGLKDMLEEKESDG